MTESGSGREKVSAGVPGWMYTFAGLMLFLLCFFVLLLSFSSQDTLQFAKVSCSLQEAFGVQKEDVADPSQGGARLPALETASFDFRQELLQALEEEMKTGLVDVGEVQDALVIRVKDTLAFASGRAEILPTFKPVLDKIGKIAREADASIIVSGHTDNVPVMQGKPFRTNWGLSTARAVGVVEYWSQKGKISSSRLSAVGYADGRPIANNSTPAGRARNRRIEFEVKSKVSGQVPGA